MQHEPSNSPSTSVKTALLWLTSVPVADRPRPLIPHLRRKFDLSALEAVDVIRRANLTEH